MSTIKTLDFLEKEASSIVSYWNGSDDRFVDGNGIARTEDDVNAANEVLEKVKELRELATELGI